jgi:hypothetical protein
MDKEEGEGKGEGSTPQFSPTPQFELSRNKPGQNL